MSRNTYFRTRHRLLTTTALVLGIGGTALSATPLHAQTTQAVQPAQTATPLIEETNRYRMRVMTQLFDGSKDFSHTQVVGVARQRRGDESWMMMNFGDGAVVVEEAGVTSASGFTNTSATEFGLTYDYATKTLSGASPIVAYHNRFVRPQLDQGPPLGADGAWTATMSLAQLGFERLGDQRVSIELKRSYFSHGGRDYALIHYRVPSFSYQANGRPIVQWGEGVALTDRSFGQIFWNATVHRAVAQDAGTSGRPYRYAKTMAALDARGVPMVDPRSMPQTAAHFARLYAAPTMAVIDFVEGGDRDATALDVAGRLDIMALSLGENSANQTPAGSDATSTGDRGNEVPSPQPSPGPRPSPTTQGNGGATITGALQTAGDTLEFGRDKGDKFLAISDGIVKLVDDSARLAEAYQFTKDNYAAALAAVKAVQPDWEMKPAVRATEKLLAAQKLELAKLAEIFDAASRTNTRILPALVTEYGRVTSAIGATTRELSAAYVEGAYVPKLSAEGIRLTANLERQAVQVAKIEAQMSLFDRSARTLIQSVQSLPTEQFSAMLEKFSNSRASKVLTSVSHFMNGYSIYRANENVTIASTTDLGTGAAPQLTRDYGTGFSGVMLVAEIGALAGNVFTGNIKGFFSDAAAMTVGSVTDVYIAAKALKDVQPVVAAAQAETFRLEGRAIEQRFRDYTKKAQDADIASGRAAIADLDQTFDDVRTEAQRMLKLRREAREATARAAALAQAKADAAAAAAELAAVRKREAQIAENARITALNEWIAGSNDRLRDAMRPTYPTADRYTPAQQAARDARIAAERAAAQAAVDEALRTADAATAAAAAARLAAIDRSIADARAAQDRRAADRAEDDARRARRSDPDMIVPVTFKPPVWVPPVFKPPVWVPPEFDAPEVSELPFGGFGDAADWLPSTSNLAYKYDDMSGRVETDLTKYAAFLKGQDVRQLERLALQAGYPNLASALADAANIKRLSQDQGYRRWAQTAPSCGGYAGCGPSSLERWAMKSSIVALGDLLSVSRDITSTAGLSDITITGTSLAYLLRDFGVQDGDDVAIKITQFGRTIDTNNLTLTNAGNSFDIALRPGVASLEILAIDEGSISPNTAEIRVDKVVKGNNTQSYSLRTGETATLRIATGGAPE